MENREPDLRTLHDFLSSLRSGDPTPGGGSAAAYAGSMGAALVAMVCRLSLQNAQAEIAEKLELAADRLDALVEELSQSARHDEECYARYRAAANLPKETGDQKAARSLAMQASLRVAAETPLLTARRALEALTLSVIVSQSGTKHALSDVQVARLLLSAAIEGALIFVEVNADQINDGDVAHGLRRAAADLRHQASASSKEIWTTIAARS